MVVFFGVLQKNVEHNTVLCPRKKQPKYHIILSQKHTHHAFHIFQLKCKFTIYQELPLRINEEIKMSVGKGVSFLGWGTFWLGERFEEQSPDMRFKVLPVKKRGIF